MTSDREQTDAREPSAVSGAGSDGAAGAQAGGAAAAAGASSAALPPAAPSPAAATAPPVSAPGAAAETNVGAGLWKGIGMWAWILFRISGLILVAYLFVHVALISQAQIGGADMLDRFLDSLENPFLVFLDLMLVSAVLYHGLNGVRVLLMDVGVGVKRHKVLFWSVMVVAGGVLAWFAAVAAPYVF